MKFVQLPALAVLAALPAIAAAQQSPAAAPAAKPNVSACTGCHTIPGYQSSFPQVYRVPMISGQNAKYIESALQAYKKGERNHPSMQGIAKGLSDAEIVALAAYYSARGADAAPSK